MKILLLDEIGEETGVALESVAGAHSAVAGTVASLLARALRPWRLGLVVRPDRPETLREEGRGWPSRALTMIGRRRLEQFEEALETVLNENIPGDVLEAGVWRGGACVLARAVLLDRGIESRRVIVADSFRGLPPPNIMHPLDRGDRHHAAPYLAVPREEVEAAFTRFGLLDEHVVFVEGWFEESLHRAPIDQLAVLRIDGDLYGSTLAVLEALYEKVHPGGFVIVDDLALKGCRRAVDDFRRRNDIREPIQMIDWTGGWWRKP